jgi:hypothetical protein
LLHRPSPSVRRQPRAAPQDRDEPEPAKDAARNILFPAESFGLRGTSQAQDAMDRIARNQQWSLEHETNPDQVQDEAGTGRPQRGADRERV